MNDLKIIEVVNDTTIETEDNTKIPAHEHLPNNHKLIRYTTSECKNAIVHTMADAHDMFKWETFFRFLR